MATIFEQIGDYVGDIDLTEPETYLQILRVLPFTGWVGALASMFEALGFVATGAEIAIHLAPGLILGDSLSDAIIADYGARLCIVVGAKVGAVLAGASSAAAVVLGQTTTTGSLGGISGAGLCGAALKKIRDAADKQLGPKKATAIAQEAELEVDREFNQAFARLMQDPAFLDLYRRAPVGGSSKALDDFGLGPDVIGDRFGVRHDVTALAINAVLHERIYPVNARTFNVITGKRRTPIAVPSAEATPEEAILAPARVQTSAQAEAALRQAERDYSAAVARDQQNRTRNLDSAQSTAEVAAYGRRIGRLETLVRQLQEKELVERDMRVQAVQALERSTGEAIRRAERRALGGVDISLGPRPAVNVGTPTGFVAELVSSVPKLALLTAPVWGTWLVLKLLR
jgi:hypothetical protein